MTEEENYRAIARNWNESPHSHPCLSFIGEEKVV